MPASWRASVHKEESLIHTHASKVGRTATAGSASTVSAADRSASAVGSKGKGRRRAKPKPSTVNGRLDALETHVEINTKAALNTADAVRELQGNLKYCWAYGEGVNPVVKAVTDEGIEYHQLTEAVRKTAEAAQKVPDFKKECGPASGHFFAAVIDTLASMNIEEREISAANHLSVVEAMQAEMSDAMTGREKAAEWAGTFHRRKAHGTTHKLVMKLECSPQQCESIFSLMKRSGMEVFVGKPPREGIHRALQAQLD